MPDTCQHEECSRKATVAPKLMVPAMHTPINLHSPAFAIIGLMLCKDHYDDLKTEDFLDDSFKEIMTIATRGLMPPDFDRAFFQKVKLDSFEWIEFKNFRNRGNA